MSKTLAERVRDCVCAQGARLAEHTVGLCCLSQRSAYKTQAWIKCVGSVRAQSSWDSLVSLCSTECLREVMRFLTFAFSITKYSHAEELQHPDGMMNSLNQPQDVIVSTHKALGLCLDWDWDYVRGNFIYAVNKPLSLSLESGKHSAIKKDLLVISFSKLMKLFQKALWKFITVPQKSLSC